MRAWVADHPHVKPLDPSSYAAKLLAKAPAIKANFARASAALSASKSAKACPRSCCPAPRHWHNFNDA